MISKETRLFKLLNSMKSDLSKYGDKEEAFREAFQIKNDRAVTNYEHTVKLNCRYILTRSNYKAIKAIERYNKKKERDQDEDKFEYGFIEVI